MTDRFRLTIAQLNPTLGDLPGNAALAFGAWQQAQAAGAQMLAMRRHRHRFHAAGHHEPSPPPLQFLRREHHGIHSGRTGHVPRHHR